MTNVIHTSEYHIDATNKRLGIVATEAAKVLLGKNTPTFTKHLAADVRVVITNVAKLDVTERRGKEIYQTYSGYPGGQKNETLTHLANRRGFAEVLRRTISGMLPSNKLKKPRLKNLVISE